MADSRTGFAGRLDGLVAPLQHPLTERLRIAIAGKRHEAVEALVRPLPHGRDEYAAALGNEIQPEVVRRDYREGGRRYRGVWLVIDEFTRAPMDAAFGSLLMGRLREGQKDAEGARKAYQEALAADAKFVSPYLQLALMAAQERKWQEVTDACDRVIRLNPLEFPQAFFFSAVAKYNLGKLEDAEKNAREAQKIDTEHRIPKVDHLLGMILAQKRSAYLRFHALQALNIMRLATPQSAILSAVIFNALIIVALIPLALKGVSYRPLGAGRILRRNLMIYGVGGVIVPFAGIKAIDLLLVALHLV